MKPQEQIDYVARRIREDYLAQYTPNRKTWDEIDEGMREVWRGYARTALKAVPECRLFHMED